MLFSALYLEAPQCKKLYTSCLSVASHTQPVKWLTAACICPSLSGTIVHCPASFPHEQVREALAHKVSRERVGAELEGMLHGMCLLAACTARSAGLAPAFLHAFLWNEPCVSGLWSARCLKVPLFHSRHTLRIVGLSSAASHPRPPPPETLQAPTLSWPCVCCTACESSLPSLRCRPARTG